MRKHALVAALAGCLSWAVAESRAAEPGWSGDVVAQGALRREIEMLPLLERPYRPFHFYGNAVRRLYYRGTPLPSQRDFFDGAAAFLRGSGPPVSSRLGPW